VVLLRFSICRLFGIRYCNTALTCWCFRDTPAKMRELCGVFAAGLLVGAAGQARGLVSSVDAADGGGLLLDDIVETSSLDNATSVVERLQADAQRLRSEAADLHARADERAAAKDYAGASELQQRAKQADVQAGALESQVVALTTRGGRRQMADLSKSSGISISSDAAAIAMGAYHDVIVSRDGPGSLLVSADLTVDGTLTVADERFVSTISDWHVFVGTLS
jgi:hypothetical protein